MHATVLGAGVIGLSAAIRLRQAGWDAAVLAAMRPSEHPRPHVAGSWPPYPASMRAAAIWYPFHVSDPRVDGWAVETLHELSRISAEEPDAGVSLVPFVELFRGAPAAYAWRESVGGFGAVPTDELPEGFSVGWRMEVPLVETPVYMPWLERRFVEMGGRIESRFVERVEDVASAETLVVNCTGLGARRLLDDADVYPCRGQIVRVRAPGVRTWRVSDDRVRGLTYVIARRDGVVLGGTAEDGVWDESVDPGEVEAIRARTAGVVPGVAEGEVLEVASGLRPQWRRGIRVEREARGDGCAVIHAYGHGGSGFTLSWGCSDEVVRLAGQREAAQDGR